MIATLFCSLKTALQGVSGRYDRFSTVLSLHLQSSRGLDDVGGMTSTPSSRIETQANGWLGDATLATLTQLEMTIAQSGDAELVALCTPERRVFTDQSDT